MIWVSCSSPGKLKLQFVSGRQKAADYVKMLNNLSLVQEGYHLRGEVWIFQQDNAAIHKASITKKYLLEQKIRLLGHPACYPDLIPIENFRGLIVAVFVDRPTQRASMAQGLFYGGSGRRAVAHTRPALPKMPTAPSAFP